MKKLVSTMMVMVGMLAVSGVANATLILTQGFEAPFDQGANYPVNGTNDSATQGGIWSSAANPGPQQNSTYSAWGNGGYGTSTSSGSGMYSGRYGDVINADLGTTLSSGIVTVSMDMRRYYRGAIIGGMSTGSTANRNGDASGMLFGVIWEHNYVYNINPNGYYGDMYAAAPQSPNTWGYITFTLNFATDTYEVVISELGVLWTGLAMNTAAGKDSLKYLYWESIPGQGGRVYYDNILVTHEVPEPATLVLLTLGALLCGKRNRA